MEPYIYVKSIELAALLVLSVASDIRAYKISNAIILIFSLAGTVSNFAARGMEGLIFSLMGWIIPIVLLFMLFRMRMLGAGDIKLFAAIGAIMGCEFAVWSILYSFLLGGAICLVLLTVRGNAKERMLHLRLYMKSCLQACRIYDYTSFEDRTGLDRFHFSFAVAPAVILQIAIIYLNTWGV